MNTFIKNQYLNSIIEIDSYTSNTTNPTDKSKDKNINELLYKLDNNVNKKELYEKIFDIMSEKLKNNTCNKIIISDNVYIDLEIFCGIAGHEHNSIFSTLDNTYTIFGKIYLQKMLYNPTDNIDKLLEERDINLYIYNNQLLKNIIDKYLKKLKSEDIYWLWNNNLDKEDFKLISNLVYYENKYLKFLNTNGMILIHDLLPGDEIDAAKKRYLPGWSGDVWKVAVELSQSEGLDFKIVNIDTGVGILKKKENYSYKKISEIKNENFDDFYDKYLDQLPIINSLEAFKFIDGN